MTFRRTHRLELIFVLAVAFILVYQLLIQPIIGLANLGDFCRTMETVGLSYPGGSFYDQNYLYVNRQFQWNPTFNLHYPTSELLFIGAALVMNAPFSRSVFDIRFLGIVHILAFLFILTILLRYSTRLAFYQRVFLYLLVGFIFTDVGYAVYFNSLYSEPASLIFLGAVIALALTSSAREQSFRGALVLLCAFVLSTILFITAKVQNVFTGLPLTLLVFRFCYSVGKENRQRFKRYAGSAALVILLVSAGYYAAYSFTPSSVKTANLYHAVFYEILAHSPTPEQDARELNVEEQYVKYAGTIAFKPETIAIRDQAVQNTSYALIVKFYLRHPGRLVGLAKRSARSAFYLRPPWLGNFEKDHITKVMQQEGGSLTVDPEHLPKQFKSNSFSAWDTLKQHMMLKSLCFLISFLLINLIAALLYRSRLKPDISRMVPEIHFSLVVMAVIQFLSVIIAEGEHDIIKHLFLFNLLCDVSLIFLIMYIVSGIAAFRRPKLNNAAGMV